MIPASCLILARCALLVCGALCIAFSNAHAARIALVMGNDNYHFVSKLRKAGNDAEAMAIELRAAGFDVSLHRDLDYRGMIKATESLYGKIQGGDEVVVFFAGHGLQIKSGNYILPIDIEANTESAVEKTSYSLNDLSERLEATKAGFSLVMIDACRDNPLKSRGRSVGAERGLSPPDPAIGQMIVYSASRGEQALDRLTDSDTNPNSVFTREFIARMRKPGVKVDELVRETQVSVEKLASSVGHKQRPALYNEARGSFYFFGPTTVVTPAPTVNSVAMYEAQREDRFWEDAKVTANRDGFNAYLEQYPNGRYASLARANINRLSGSMTETSSSPVQGASAVVRAPPLKEPGTPVPSITLTSVVAKPNSQPSPSSATVPILAPATEKTAVPAAIPTSEPSLLASAPKALTTRPVEVAAIPAAAAPEVAREIPTVTKSSFTLPNGDRYEGQVVGVTRTGVGSYIFANGDRYDGDFVNDQFQGHGIFRAASGEVFEGDFEHGLKNGQGIYRFVNGDQYEGKFVKNIFTGKGVIKLANGDRYEGEILNGVKHGQGIHFFANKDRYEGGFVAGMQDGIGTHYYSNGDKYQGGFKGGVRHGKGTYRFASGLEKATEFNNGIEKE